jgi:hypothetical protein
MEVICLNDDYFASPRVYHMVDRGIGVEANCAQYYYYYVLYYHNARTRMTLLQGYSDLCN